MNKRDADTRSKWVLTNDLNLIRKGLNMKDLRNKVAIVTGSSSGVGAATAKLLASKGCRVLVNYNSNSAGASAVLAECQNSGEMGLLSREMCQ